MSRHRMFVASNKAQIELGYHTGSIEAALERAIRWYEENGYWGARAARKPLAQPAAA